MLACRSSEYPLIPPCAPHSFSSLPPTLGLWRHTGGAQVDQEREGGRLLAWDQLELCLQLNGAEEQKGASHPHPVAPLPQLFELDFLVVPIHLALHWSLAIVAHPSGLLASGDQGKKKEVEVDLTGVEDQGAAPAEAGEGGGSCGLALPGARGAPVILHLDSLRTGHETLPVAGALRCWLNSEWTARKGRNAGYPFNEQSIP